MTSGLNVLPTNIHSHLWLREIGAAAPRGGGAGGLRARSLLRGRVCAYKKVPARLQTQLRSLLTAHELNRGSIFMCFSADGCNLLSYATREGSEGGGFGVHFVLEIWRFPFGGLGLDGEEVAQSFEEQRGEMNEKKEAEGELKRASNKLKLVAEIPLFGQRSFAQASHRGHAHGGATDCDNTRIQICELPEGEGYVVTGCVHAGDNTSPRGTQSQRSTMGGINEDRDSDDDHEDNGFARDYIDSEAESVEGETTVEVFVSVIPCPFKPLLPAFAGAKANTRGERDKVVSNDGDNNKCDGTNEDENGNINFGSRVMGVDWVKAFHFSYLSCIKHLPPVQILRGRFNSNNFSGEIGGHSLGQCEDNPQHLRHHHRDGTYLVKNLVGVVLNAGSSLRCVWFDYCLLVQTQSQNQQQQPECGCCSAKTGDSPTNTASAPANCISKDTSSSTETSSDDFIEDRREESECKNGSTMSNLLGSACFVKEGWMISQQHTVSAVSALSHAFLRDERTRASNRVVGPSRNEEKLREIRLSSSLAGGSCGKFKRDGLPGTLAMFSPCFDSSFDVERFLLNLPDVSPVAARINTFKNPLSQNPSGLSFSSSSEPPASKQSNSARNAYVSIASPSLRLADYDMQLVTGLASYLECPPLFSPLEDSTGFIHRLCAAENVGSAVAVLVIEYNVNISKNSTSSQQSTPSAIAQKAIPTNSSPSSFSPFPAKNKSDSATLRQFGVPSFISSAPSSLLSRTHHEFVYVVVNFLQSAITFQRLGWAPAAVARVGAAGAEAPLGRMGVSRPSSVPIASAALDRKRGREGESSKGGLGQQDVAISEDSSIFSLRTLAVTSAQLLVKRIAVPTNKGLVATVATNATVFTGRSLPFIVNPFFPIAVRL